jgi:hypothetical protein
MSAQKFEKLIELIINENKEQAEQLFHDIIVEKSREIYEGIMAEEDPAMDLQDEIQAEGEGMEGLAEEGDEFGDEEFGADDGEEEFGDEIESAPQQQLGAN